MTFAVFYDFPGLENGLPKFQDFPRLSRTCGHPAIYCSMYCLCYRGKRMKRSGHLSVMSSVARCGRRMSSRCRSNSRSSCCELVSRPCIWARSLPATRRSAGATARSNCATAAAHSGWVYGLYWTALTPENAAKASCILSSLHSCCVSRRPSFSCTARTVTIYQHTSQCGSRVQWLAHLEFKLENPGSNPGSRHYSIG